MTDENIMRKPKIKKITLNVGAGKDQKVLEKGVKLIEHITGIKPIKTLTDKRLQAWGLRPGLPVGCKLTIRDQEKIFDLIDKFLDAKEHTLTEKQFDEQGNLSFGVPEYIDIKGVNYNPDIGMMGLEMSITIERPGYRIKRRRLKQKKVPPKQRVTKKEAIQFMKDNFKIKLEEEEMGEE